MRLGDFAEVHLGYKSLMNDFFYLNDTQVERFGIEDRYLVPIYRLQDLNSAEYWQLPQRNLRLFYCTDEPYDLVGTGAGKYVHWGARQETRAKKQSGGITTWEKALSKQSGRRWYHPKDAVRPAKIAFRKGIGRKYAPYLFDSPTLLDQRLYGLQSLPGVDENILIAYLASSLFPLTLEVNADLGLGAGVLTLGTESLRELPCVDLIGISASRYLPGILTCLEELVSQPALTLEGHAKSQALRRLDEKLLVALGFAAGRAEELASEVVLLGRARLALANERTKAKVAASELNISSVANGIAQRVRSWLSARRFPEDWLGSGKTTRLTLPSEPFEIKVDTLLASCRLTFRTHKGRLILEAEYNVSVAEVLVRAIQLGRRNVTILLDHQEAKEALRKLDDLRVDLRGELERLVEEAAVSFRYEGDVRGKALERLGLRLVDLERDFASAGRWFAPVVS